MLGQWDREHGEPAAGLERFRGHGGRTAWAAYMRGYEGRGEL
jgi:hypothetical protein